MLAANIKTISLTCKFIQIKFTAYVECIVWHCDADLMEKLSSWKSMTIRERGISKQNTFGRK